MWRKPESSTWRVNHLSAGGKKNKEELERGGEGSDTISKDKNISRRE